MPTLLPLPQAAVRLGVSQSALRRRLRAGVAQGERRPSAGGFTWYVEVPDAAPTLEAGPGVGDAEPTPTPAPTLPPAADALELAAAREAIKRLEAHVASLTDELGARRREVAEEREAHHRQVQALMALLGREQIASLPAPIPEGERPPGPGAPAPTPRPWWRRAWAALTSPAPSA